MFLNNCGNNVGLVRWMQPCGDLKNAWILFDHVKHVVGWNTMACHIYDSIYYKVMITIIYDMQSKSMKLNVFYEQNFIR